MAVLPGATKLAGIEMAYSADVQIMGMDAKHDKAAFVGASPSKSPKKGTPKPMTGIQASIVRASFYLCSRTDTYIRACV